LALALIWGLLNGTATSLAQVPPLTRTWVSATGSNANACSRTAPCLTFAGALAKTAAGGEINVLDPGSYGAVTINKSITIDGAGTSAGIMVTGIAVSVNAGNNDIITLRNLDIHGAGVGTYGVLFSNGKQLNIESTTITGFTNSGVFVPVMTGAGNLAVTNSTISATANSLPGLGNAIEVNFGNAIVSHSLITENTGTGLLAANYGVINADNNVLTYNGVAARAGVGTTPGVVAVRLSNNDVYNNGTGFGCGPGTLASAGNNRKGSNSGGTVAACAPTVIITQQ
jgi:hypothetical protein